MLRKYLRHLVPIVRYADFIPVTPEGWWRHRAAPTKSLKTTASLFDRMEGQVIVEIGTGLHGNMAGNSISHWVKTRARKIVAVDLSEDRLNEVKSLATRDQRIELVHADGVRFLEETEMRIDLLYLDFWVSDPEGAFPGTGRANAYKQAFSGAREKMNKTSLILIDDTDHVDPYKQSYIVPDARSQGFLVLHTGRQTLLARGFE